MLKQRHSLGQHPFFILQIYRNVLCFMWQVRFGFILKESLGCQAAEVHARIRMRMPADNTAARTDVPAKLSQIPVSPRGQSAAISITGKTRAVDTEIRDAGSGFSMASI